MSHDLDPSLLERAAALKHDLGKYVAWRSANLDDDAWNGPITDTLVEALQADLLRTRERSQGDLAAWEVFAAHTSDLPSPLPEPELRTVAAAVAVLQAHEPALRAADREGLAAARPALRKAQQDIRAALRDFHRRMLSMPPAADVERATTQVPPKGGQGGG